MYSETELKQNLVSWGPLSVCVDAASWQDYVSGVMTWEECAWVNLLDHCVQLVGYGTDAKAGPSHKSCTHSPSPPQVPHAEVRNRSLGAVPER